MVRSRPKDTPRPVPSIDTRYSDPSEFFEAALGLRQLSLAFPRKSDRETAQRYADMLHKAGVALSAPPQGGTDASA